MHPSIRPATLLKFGTLILLCCSPAHAAGPAVQVGSAFRKMGTLDCTLKALEAMGIDQNFMRAEIHGSDVWGYDERSFVMVHSVPIRDGVNIIVVAFSDTPGEAERLRNAIREHIFNGSLRPSRLRVEDMPKVHQAADASRRRGAIVAQWGNFNKVATLPTFQSCARGAMAQHKLQESVSGQQIVFGMSNSAAVVVFGVGEPRGTQVLVISASHDSAEAERLRNEVRTSIVGCSSL